MKSNPPSIITWCQPPDTKSADVIVIDGVVAGESEVEKRSNAVSRMNEVAREGTRIDLPGRGWKSVSREGVALQVPVESDDERIKPSVGALVPRLDEMNTTKAADQIVQTAQLAGYQVSQDRVIESLMYESAKPRGLFAKIVRWFLSLFGIKGKA